LIKSIKTYNTENQNDKIIKNYKTISLKWVH
jgi:hypothetical protein